MTEQDRRRYVRVPSIVPVDYQLLDAGGAPLDSQVRTGFTRDFSPGGMRVVLSGLPPAVDGEVRADPPRLRITVDVDLPGRRLRVSGRIAWSRAADVDAGSHRRLVGVELPAVSGEDTAALMSYARRASRRPKLVSIAVASLLVALAISAGLIVWLVEGRSASLAASATAHEAYLREQQRIAEVTRGLRWVSEQIDEVDELVRELDPVAGPVPRELPESVDTLRQQVARLRLSLDAARDGQAEPRQAAAGP